MANVVPWSYSSLTAFETCPKRFQLTRLLKKVVEPSSEAMTHGNEVHKALELATLGEKPLADKYKQYQPLVERLRAKPGKRSAGRPVRWAWRSTRSRRRRASN